MGLEIYHPAFTFMLTRPLSQADAECRHRNSNTKSSVAKVTILLLFFCYQMSFWLSLSDSGMTCLTGSSLLRERVVA